MSPEPATVEGCSGDHPPSEQPVAVSISFWLSPGGWVCRAHFGVAGRGATAEAAIADWSTRNQQHLVVLQRAWTMLAESGELPPSPSEDGWTPTLEVEDGEGAHG